MSELKLLLEKIIRFRDRRDWKQFHTPKNLAESLVLEASEVLEHFQWKNDEEIKEHLKNNKAEFSHELADVLNYLLLLADETGVDLNKALLSKLALNNKKNCQAPLFVHTDSKYLAWNLAGGIFRVE